MKNNILTFLFSILTVWSIHAQSNLQIRTYSTSDGLAQRHINQIIQDHKGFIWFSTRNGIGKFDGYEFRQYKTYPSEDNSMKINRISSIHLDAYNNIWCKAYDNKVYLFHTQEEKFTYPLAALVKEKQTSPNANQIYPLAKGTTWITHTNGAFRIDRSNKEMTIEEYSTERKNLPHNHIINIHQDMDGDEWLLTDKGVCLIGQKHFPADSTYFKDLQETPQSVFLLSADNRLAAYNKATQELHFIEMPLTDRRLTCIALIKEELLIGAENLVLSYHTTTDKFSTIPLDGLSKESIQVKGVYKDTYGELWIYSNHDGVIHYNPQNRQKRMLQIQRNPKVRNELESKDLIFEDQQGTLWLVPHKGEFCFYDREAQELRNYYTDKLGNAPYTPILYTTLYDGNNTLWYSDHQHLGKISFSPSACHFTPLDAGFETRAFLKDQSNRLWISTKKGSVRIFNPDKTLKGFLGADGHIYPQETKFGCNVYCFMQDHRGDIWMGTKKDGVIRLQKKDEHSYRMTKFTTGNQLYSLSGNSVYSIIQDSQERIWIATYGGGLNLLQEDNEGNVRFYHHQNSPNFPSQPFSKMRIIREANGTLLIGSTEGLISCGLQFEHPEEISFHYNVCQPGNTSSLCGNDIIKIHQDNGGNIYLLSFSGGINRIISSDLLSDSIRFKCYTETNGLPSDLVLSIAEDRQGDLWIMAESTLMRFNPQAETFENYGNKHLPKGLYLSEGSTLLWNDKIVTTTENGYLEIIPSLLKKSTYSPHIVLTRLQIQGKEPNTAIDSTKSLNLLPDQRNIAIGFLALDYTNPPSIQYAYRLKGLEKNWNMIGNNRQARYINLPPGDYEFQVKATNSDGIWTENIKSLPIHVIPTFWETRWAWILYILLFILFAFIVGYIFFTIYRLRHRINIEQQLSHIKLRFFTDISHELRTPLTLITSPVSEVLEHEPLSPNARKYLTVVRSNTERMLQLINQILDFRKIENKKMKLLLENTDVIGMANRIMDDFSLMAEEKQIRFTLQAEESNLYAYIDKDKFQKILFNLISNAFKHTPNGKAITVSIHTEETAFVVSVKDEGKGIDPKRLSSLFKRFETLLQENILQPSSGIELSLVKELTELHLGSIQAESQQGMGSLFTVRLPLYKEAYESIDYKEYILEDFAGNEITVPQPEALPTTDETGKDIRILIVEDNTELRSFLKDILSESYQVMEATNGQEGLDLAKLQVPDFIISDIMMPVMDGLDMVKAIKEDRDICHIPIILLSAKSSLDDRIHGLEQGIDDYITKPFSSTYLKTRIQYLLQQRKQLQQRFMEQYTTAQANKYTEPSPIQITPFDEQFMQTVKDVVEKQMENPEFSIDMFAQEVNMGRTTFYQKLKNITGMTPIDFLQAMRIKRGVQLMDSGEYNVSTVAYKIGFNDPKYFSKCFKKHMGVTPTEYCKGKSPM